MTAAKHTRGPWAYRALRGDDGLGYIEADGRDIIHAGVSTLGKDENEANARLIAASPRMFAYVEQRAAEAIIDDFVAGLSPGDDPKADAALKALRAAIARATLSKATGGVS